MKERRRYQIIPRKDTKPEILLQQALKNENIQFIKHVALLGQPDIFIEPNICIFVDGDYWHTLPKAIKRDYFVNEYLENQDYQVLRFWSSEIESDLQNVITEITYQINRRNKNWI